MGYASDRFGRRPVLLASFLGSGLGFLLTGVAQSYVFCVFARVVGGLMGGSIPVAQARKLKQQREKKPTNLPNKRISTPNIIYIASIPIRRRQNPTPAAASFQTPYL